MYFIFAFFHSVHLLIRSVHSFFVHPFNSYLMFELKKQKKNEEVFIFNTIHSLLKLFFLLFLVQKRSVYVDFLKHFLFLALFERGKDVNCTSFGQLFDKNGKKTPSYLDQTESKQSHVCIRNVREKWLIRSEKEPCVTCNPHPYCLFAIENSLLT